MNARMTAAGEVQLPKEIIDALDLKPGSAVEFRRGPGGEVILDKASEPLRPTSEEWRRRIESVRGTATELKGMTTDEFMQFLRGDD